MVSTLNKVAAAYLRFRTLELQRQLIFFVDIFVLQLNLLLQALKHTLVSAYHWH